MVNLVLMVFGKLFVEFLMLSFSQFIFYASLFLLSFQFLVLDSALFILTIFILPSECEGILSELFIEGVVVFNATFSCIINTLLIFRFDFFDVLKAFLFGRV